MITQTGAIAQLDTKAIAARLVNRFDWLRNANRSSGIARLQEIFTSLEVQRVAPIRGSLLEELRSAVLERTLEALSRLDELLDCS